MTPLVYDCRMSKRKTTYYIEDGVLTAAKMTAVATHRSESLLVEDAIRAYVIDGGRGEAARDDMRKLLEELRQRPDLNDLSDEETTKLAAQEVKAMRQERAAKQPRSAATE
jgi:hypothetical protein